MWLTWADLGEGWWCSDDLLWMTRVHLVLMLMMILWWCWKRWQWRWKCWWWRIKLQNSMQGLLKRNIIYCIGNNYVAWQHMRWNEYIELCDRETHWEFFFVRANLEWGDCHGGINASKLQVYYWQRSKNSLVTVNDVGSSGDSLNISWIFLCIYCFLVVCLKLFLFITSPIGRYVFYLHWNMVGTRVRRAPSFQHLTRQRQITVSSQSQPLPANKQNDVDNWMMKTHIKNIIHFLYMSVSPTFTCSHLLYIRLSKTIHSIPIAI